MLYDCIHYLVSIILAVIGVISFVAIILGIFVFWTPKDQQEAKNEFCTDDSSSDYNSDSMAA